MEDGKTEDGNAEDGNAEDGNAWDWKLWRKEKLNLSKYYVDGFSWPLALQLLLLIAVTCFFLILIYDSDLAENMQKRFRNLDYSSQKPPDWSQESHDRADDSSKVYALLEDIRRLIAVAAAGEDFSFSAAEEAAWHAQNPCESRAELSLIYQSRKYVDTLPDHHLWNEVLSEYSKLHRTCMKRVGDDLTAYFTGNVDIPGCNFLVTEPGNGLGNKLLVLVSGLMYAIVTGRIIVLAYFDSELLCEPFVGSTWIIKGDFPFPGTEEGNKHWEHGDNIMGRADVQGRMTAMKETNACYGRGCISGSMHQPPVSRSVVVASGLANWQPSSWFYCNMEQNVLADVPWLYFSGCIYSAPKLFGSPAFASILHALFPKNMAITILLRTTCLPGDAAWERFKRLNRAYFQHANRRVGIQLRYYGDGHETIGRLILEHVVDCVLNNRILPNVSSDLAEVAGKMRGKTPSSHQSTRTVVYIASLFTDMRDWLTEFYLHSPTETQEDVTVVQLTAHKAQTSGQEEDREALVEMLLLSSTDELIVTPMSTFGGIAQGYGGLIPWFVRASDDTNLLSCERAQTVDTCQQAAPIEYTCHNDNPSGPTYSPSIGKCLEIDVGVVGGVQMLTG